MATNQSNHVIENYKSELVKKEEIIEKLFEEVDELKENQQERNNTFKKLEKQFKLLQVDYHKSLDTCNNITKENKNYCDKLDKVNLLLERSETEKNELKKQLFESQEKIHTLENYWNKRESEWRNQYDKLVSLYNDLETTIADWTGETD
ncbi:13761_t:CDS:1 [Funneliformis mosseae]|nr:13761_t:CDS:1 [Funneliformis mosseae]